jgi:hypothetical protein
VQAHYPASFEREVGSTEAEWLMRLPGAVRDHGLELHARSANVAIDTGVLQMAWHELPPRRIALMNMPCMAVSFRFEGVADDKRHTFMRYFDLYMQRGGG